MTSFGGCNRASTTAAHASKAQVTIVMRSAGCISKPIVVVELPFILGLGISSLFLAT